MGKTSKNLKKPGGSGSDLYKTKSDDVHKSSKQKMTRKETKKRLAEIAVKQRELTAQAADLQQQIAERNGLADILNNMDVKNDPKPGTSDMEIEEGSPFGTSSSQSPKAQ